MTSIRVEITPIGKAHRASIKRFTCGEESLDFYLKRFAERHSLRDHVSRTYLALSMERDGSREVLGYYSLSACSIEHRLIAEHDEIPRLPRFPVPGVLLARLATSTRARGQGLGRRLFAHALRVATSTSRAVGLRLFVTDALNSSAMSFYEAMGMVVLDPEEEHFPRKMVLDLHQVTEVVEGTS